MATSVPDTDTFSLQDVVDVISSTSLTEAFTNSTDGYFDAIYKGDKNNLYNFRNYTISSGLAVGDLYQGGKIAYILNSGDPGYVIGEDHGFIVATEDQTYDIPWSNVYDVFIEVTSTGLMDGDYNTDRIVIQDGCTSGAAKTCYDLSFGGYSDWYLPSKDELAKMYINRVAIGGFTGGHYWSSSEYSADQVYGQYFTDGTVYTYTKNSSMMDIRAVRYF